MDHQPDVWVISREVAELVDVDARPAIEAIVLDLLGPDLEEIDGEDPATVARFRELLDAHGLVNVDGRIRRA